MTHVQKVMLAARCDAPREGLENLGVFGNLEDLLWRKTDVQFFDEGFLTTPNGPTAFFLQPYIAEVISVETRTR